MAKKKITEERTASATIGKVRISPRKLRLEVNLIKGRQVEPALQILRSSPRKASQICRKLLESAIANARETKGLDVDRLWITEAYVNGGESAWRFMPRAQGRATPIQKKTSHATLVLGEK